MSVYVVDASVAAKWFFNEVHSQDVLRFLAPANQLHAPDFMLLELDNLVCKRVRRSEITQSEGRELREAFRTLPIELHPFLGIAEGGFELAVQTGRSLYDCLYLALAVSIDATVVTADLRFLNALADSPVSPYITWVATT